MAKVNLTLARKKHLEWKSVLRAFLDGRSTLSEEQALSHRECALGHWYYGEGLSRYGHLPEFKAVEAPHAEMHDTVQRVVQLANAGRMSDAEREYQKIDPLSREVVARLNDVEMKINAGAASWAGGLKRLTIKAKIIGYGALVTLLVAGVGYLGYAGVGQMRANTGEITRSSVLVEASKEMKLSVARDMQMVMEILTAGDDTELEAAWREHEGFAADFDLYGGAILNGAKTDMGEIFAATDEALRQVVNDADRFHNDEFLPKIKLLRGMMTEQFGLQTQRSQAMEEFETAYATVKRGIDALRAAVRERIATRTAEGEDATRLLREESSWLTGAVMAEEALGRMRIAIEEYAQGLDGARRSEVEQEYGEAVSRFDAALDALLKGGEIGGMSVPRVTDPELSVMLTGLAAAHDDRLSVSAPALMAAIRDIARTETETAELDNAIDTIGEHMLELLDGVEKVAKRTMASTSAESEAAADTLTAQMVAAVAIGAVLSAISGFLITTAVTVPLARALEVTGELSQGNLDIDIEVDRLDEMGRLLVALKNTVEGLRTVVLEVRHGAATVAGAAAEISSGNADMSQRTEEQASSLEETASSMEELTSTVRQNADNARQANQLAATAREEAERGGAVVSQAIGAMSGINASSKRIAEIVGVVDEIAFQTNLLALNAAVEAARAGEQGRGFAVVAAEVRKLAQRSSDSAKEISELIKDSVTKVEEGSRLVDQSGSTLNELMAAVKRVADIVAEISAASSEQSAGIEQVNKAVAQMDEVTQQNAAMVEEMAASAKGLEEQAGTLRQLVDFFKVTA